MDPTVFGTIIGAAIVSGLSSLFGARKGAGNGKAAEMLARIDARTERMDGRLERVETRVDDLGERVDKVEYVTGLKRPH